VEIKSQMPYHYTTAALPDLEFRGVLFGAVINQQRRSNLQARESPPQTPGVHCAHRFDLAETRVHPYR
jgi:hypothetical protein